MFSTHCLLHSIVCFFLSSFFFFNDTATTEIYTLSLHDALPISVHRDGQPVESREAVARRDRLIEKLASLSRSEEHTSELQSRQYLVCRLLLEKKKKKQTHTATQPRLAYLT